MIRMTVMYPNADDAYFDMDYYRNSHIPLVEERCEGAIKSCSVAQGLGEAEMGSEPPYVVITYLDVESMDDFMKYVAPHDSEFAADVPNFTNIQPVIQVCEVVI
jgi:uncharacterized protein (TIGR02118 family)